MTVLAHRALPPPARPGWQAQADCLNLPGGLDLVELSEEHRQQAEDNQGLYAIENRRGVTVRSWAEDLAAARQVCGGCPVQTECRWDALADRTAAGFVAGTTEVWRKTWRRRQAEQQRQLRLRDYTVADVVTVDELTPAFVAEQVEAGPAPARRTYLPEAVEAAILRLSAAGLEASEIARRLSDVDDDVRDRPRIRVTETQVRHVRQLANGSKDRRRRTA